MRKNKRKAKKAKAKKMQYNLDSELSKQMQNNLDSVDALVL